MSPFRSVKMQSMHLYTLPSRLIWAMIVFAFSLGICHVQAQLPPNVSRRLDENITNGEFRAIGIALDAWVSRAKSAPDDQKLPFIKDVIKYAAAIMATCDPSLHEAFDVGPEPPFDWKKYGIRPIFNGVSPDVIEDPVAREAYKSALSNHRTLMVRVSAEREKLGEADACAQVASLVVEASSNRTALGEAVGKHIASIQDAQWIRDRLTRVVLQKSQSKGSDTGSDHEVR